MKGCLLDFDWKSDNRPNNPLHQMCSRICSFPPALPRYFIEKYSKKGDVFLDPFCGKGTAPLEAALLGRKAIGNDISPEAFILTKAKLNPISLVSFNEKLKELEYEMGFIDSIKDVEDSVKIFFHPYTLKQILELKELLANDNSKEATFIKAVLLGILHGSASYSLSLRCSHTYSMSPNYVKKYAKRHGLKKPKRDVIECLKIKGKQLLYNNDLNFEGVALNYDSRKLPLESDSVDISVFSPPYLNVQTYAYDNWLRLWFLGYDYKEVRKKIMQSGSLETYKRFMFESLSEVYRLLKSGASCFIVVGDVKRKTSKGYQIIEIANHLRELSLEIGFECKGIFTDSIPANKKSMVYTKTCGVRTEKILYLVK